MSYIGSTPTTQSFISGTDYFNGTGAQTAFTLSRTVASVNDIQAVVNNVVQVPNDAYTISGTTITFTSAPSSGTQNVYVRYLSTTTQAITPSQGTVSWSTLDSNVQGDLGVMFKNRIINGNMVINQRGGTISASDSGWTYGLDRWAAYQNIASSKFTIQQSSTAPTGFTNSLLATSSSAYSVGSGDFFGIRQPIEGFNTADLAWGTANAKTVTLSFWVRCSVTGTFAGFIQDSNAGTAQYPFTYTVNAANTFEYKTVTIVGPTIGSWQTNSNGGPAVVFNMGVGSSFFGTANVWTASAIYGVSGQTNLVATNGATWFLTGVQFEVGTQATTFTTAGGSYGAELLLCYRYYYQLGGDTAYQSINTVAWYTAADAVGYFSYPVTMRTAPSIAKTGTWVVLGGGGTVGQTLSGDQLGNKTVQLGFAGGSGGTTGQASTLRANNDTSLRVTFNAEL
jgi:hypothetical protein